MSWIIYPKGQSVIRTELQVATRDYLVARFFRSMANRGLYDRTQACSRWNKSRGRLIRAIRKAEKSLGRENRKFGGKSCG